MVELVKTSDTVTASRLEEIIGDTPSGDVIPVCSGQWRKNPDATYTFWEDPTMDD